MPPDATEKHDDDWNELAMTGRRFRAPDFVRQQISADLESGVLDRAVLTRFPPEPNGYLHIGHAKSIVTNFDIAAEYGGACNLRFDDTNPATEETQFYDAIVRDLRWLGYEPASIGHASDHFEQLYQWAEGLVTAGLAYVDDQDAATISSQRGGFGQPGIDSPFRNRSVAENLDLFRRMRAGEFANGDRVLRAKIDMQADNLTLRDPVLYRVRRLDHPRTGDEWCIFPTYDWAHGQVDAIEGVTHSLATLEFGEHRPLYDWLLQHIELPQPGITPRQIEFARLNLTHTVTSKRKLRTLVDDGTVDGWDDPRMPTLRGMRRRGYPPSAIVEFLRHIGLSKTNSTVDVQLLESFVRAEHNATALRRMAVLDPLKLVITNWPAERVVMADVANNPEDPEAGTRSVPFAGEVWIERDDFALEPPPKFYRLSVGREVRLRNAFYVTATDVITDEAGNVIEVHATYDPDSEGGTTPDGRKVRSTLHWVSAIHAIDRTVHLYDHLFLPSADALGDEASSELAPRINPASRETRAAKAEPAVAEVRPGEVVQFERLGYFAADLDSPNEFHRTVALRDAWERIRKRETGH